MADTQFGNGNTTISKSNTTGAAAMAASKTLYRPAKLTEVSVKFSAAPTTSENFVITLDANAGAAYDKILYTVDPSSGAATSIVWQPDSPLWLEPGDVIAVTYTNTDTRTYGVQITTKERM